MTKDEALDLALEALEELQPDDAYPYSLQSKAITAIKQARALDKKAENARELGLDYEPADDIQQMISDAKAMAGKEQLRFVGELADGKWKRWDGEPVAVKYFGQLWALTKPAQPAPVQEPVAFKAGVPPLYPEMKDGETISVEYTTPPAAQRQCEGCDKIAKP